MNDIDTRSDAVGPVDARTPAQAGATKRTTEQALVDSELRYRRLFETAKDGILILDAESAVVVDVNPFLLALMGFTREQLLGKTIWDLGFLKDVWANEDKFNELRMVEYVRYDNLPLESSDGRKIEVEFVSNVYLVDDHKVIQCNIRDQTTQRASDRKLRDAESVDLARSDFIATMSHELRTPLNSIIGLTDVVLQRMSGPLTDVQDKQLGMVLTSARHLLALINDVLDLSRIEAGKVETRNESFDLRESIARVVALIQPLAEKKGLTLTTLMTADVHGFVGDRRRVEQILINLLNNAVKFTANGGVTLTVGWVADHRLTPDADPLPVLRVSVADTGIGIKPENLARLFEPFQQVDSTQSRVDEGTGLGLAICRRLAAALGGELTAVSEFGKRSVFTLILPPPGPPAVELQPA